MKVYTQKKLGNETKYVFDKFWDFTWKFARHSKIKFRNEIVGEREGGTSERILDGEVRWGGEEWQGGEDNGGMSICKHPPTHEIGKAMKGKSWLQNKDFNGLTTHKMVKK